MTAFALVFPGQGSQVEGMGQAWQGHPAHRFWEAAGNVLRWDVERLGHDAGAAELRDPRACQVALFVHHAVLLEAWRTADGGRPVVVAGHSLGEYSALLAAGVLGFADGLRLVEARATLTQRAAEQAPGGMIACIGMDVDVVAAAAADAGAHVANDNAPTQVVVAGDHEALERLRAALDGLGGRLATLDVGAAYHSPHVGAAVEPYRAVLDRTAFADAHTPVVANVDALPHADRDDWPGLLAEQLTAPVRWRETVQTLAAMGVTEVVELGATPVLTSLTKRTAPQLARRSVTAPADLELTDVLR